jgi:hypothetical protein
LRIRCAASRDGRLPSKKALIQDRVSGDSALSDHGKELRTTAADLENGAARPRGRRGAHLPEVASQGGQAVVKKYGAEHMARIGRLGAQRVADKYGPGVYAEMGARNKGVKKRRRPAEP